MSRASAADRGGVRAASGRPGDPAGPGRPVDHPARDRPDGRARARRGAAGRQGAGRLPGRPSGALRPAPGRDRPRSRTARTLAELWTDVLEPGVQQGELDAVGGHPVQRRVVRDHPDAAAAAARRRRRQRPHLRARRRPGRTTGQPRPARRAGPAGPRRDRPGHVQPPLRAPRAARVRDLTAPAGRGPGLDRRASWPSAEAAAVRLRGAARRPAADAGTRPGPSWSGGIRGRPASCTTSSRPGPGSPGTASAPAAR